MKKTTFLLSVGGVLVAMLFLVCVSVASIYTVSSVSPVARAVARIVPVPAVRVNQEYIPVRRLHRSMETLAKATGQTFDQVDPTNALDRLVTQELNRQFAASFGLVLSSQEIDEARARLFIDENPGIWTQEELDEEFVYPILLNERLVEVVQVAESAHRQEKERILDLESQIREGRAFASVAAQNEEISLAASGGDLGMLVLSDLPESWQRAIEVLSVDQVSSVVETPEAFTLIKLIDRIAKEESTQVHIAVVSVKKQPLEAVFAEFRSKASVKQWID